MSQGVEALPVCNTGVRSTSVRLIGLDRLRGLAVALMVLDHSWLVLGLPAVGVREVLTRLSLPLFCVVGGSLAHRLTWRRVAVLAALGAILGVVGAPLGIGQPDILVLLAGALAFVRFVPRPWGLVGVCAAVMQSDAWEVPWTGYQPGTVFALVVMGQYLGSAWLHSVGSKRLDGYWEWLGRHALAIYVVHLLALFLVGMVRYALFVGGYTF